MMVLRVKGYDRFDWLPSRLAEQEEIQEVIIHSYWRSGNRKEGELKSLFQALEESPQIKNLVLSGYTISQEVMAVVAEALKNNQVLKQIYLEHCHLEYCHVTQVSLERAAVAVFIADILVCNQTLEHLSLNRADIRADEIALIAGGLARSQSLRVLTLKDNFIGAEGARHIAEALKRNNTLMQIDLGRTHIGSEGAAFIAGALERNRTLQKLSLECNEVDPEGIALIADALLHNQALRTLNLWGNSIGIKGSEHIANVLKSNRTLQELKLNDYNVGDEGLKLIADGLANNRGLRSFILGGVEGEGIRYIADALKHNQTLRQFTLLFGNIKAAGGALIAEVLMHNKTLEELNLDGISIGDEGERHVANALRYNHTLRKLTIGNKWGGRADVTDIAESLKCNTVLEHFILGYRYIGPQGAILIGEAIKSNKTLLRLCLQSTVVELEGVARIAEAVEANDSLMEIRFSKDDSEAAPELVETINIKLARSRLPTLARKFNCSVGELRERELEELNFELEAAGIVGVNKYIRSYIAKFLDSEEFIRLGQALNIPTSSNSTDKGKMLVGKLNAVVKHVRKLATAEGDEALTKTGDILEEKCESIKRLVREETDISMLSVLENHSSKLFSKISLSPAKNQVLHRFLNEFLQLIYQQKQRLSPSGTVEPDHISLKILYKLGAGVTSATVRAMVSVSPQLARVSLSDSNTMLHYLICRGSKEVDIELLKEVIAVYPDALKGPNQDGHTPIDVAFGQGDMIVVDLLHREMSSRRYKLDKDKVRRIEATRVEPSTGNMLLHKCANGTLQLLAMDGVQKIIEANPSALCVKNRQGYTPLQLAVAKNNKVAASKIIEYIFKHRERYGYLLEELDLEQATSGMRSFIQQKLGLPEACSSKPPVEKAVLEDLISERSDTLPAELESHIPVPPESSNTPSSQPEGGQGLYAGNVITWGATALLFAGTMAAGIVIFSPLTLLMGIAIFIVSAGVALAGYQAVDYAAFYFVDRVSKAPENGDKGRS